MRYDTKEEYRADWNKAGSVTPRIPLNIDLELASVCNLSCPFCFISDDSFKSMISQKSHDGKPRRRFMSTDLASKIIHEAEQLGVPALKFNWRGESTLHPDFWLILSWAANADRDYLNPPFTKPMNPAFHEILVNTNANCSDMAIRGLMNTTKVMVSLDSMDPDTYAKMRVGGNLRRALDTIQKLTERNHSNIWVRRVITEQNKHENFYQDVREYFGDKVHVSEHPCIENLARFR